MFWLLTICFLGLLFVIRSIVRAFRRSKELAERKRAAIHFAYNYAIACYSNLFWAMVMGYCAYEESEIGYLARELHSVMKKLPKKNDLETIKRQSFLLGLELWKGYESKRKLNSGYPAIFWHFEEKNQSGDVASIVGRDAFSGSSYTYTTEDGIQQKGYGWIFTSEFLAKLIRLHERGISTVLVPLPSLGKYHHLLSENELPPLYRKLLQREAVPYVPDVQAAVKYIDKLLATEDRKLVTKAKELQERLNTAVVAGLKAEIPLRAFADHSFETQPSAGNRQDPEALTFLVESVEEQVVFFQKLALTA